MVLRENYSDGSIEAVSHPAGGSWSSPTTISAPGGNPYYPGLAGTSGGDFVVVWRRNDGSSWSAPGRARVAVSAEGPNVEWPEITMDPEGDALAVWQASDGTNEIARASSRSAGGAWSAPTDLSTDGGNVAFPRAVLDSHGNAMATWSRTDGPFGAVVQTATRPAGGDDGRIR